MSPITRRRFLLSSGALISGAALGRSQSERQATEKTIRDDDSDSGRMINAFGIDLYSQLRSEKGNVFFSPFSISTALGMTATGARGVTLSQMQSVLHLPAQTSVVDSRYASLMKSLSPSNAKYQLTTANAIWAQKGFQWKSEFKNRVAKYGAGLHDADFAIQADKERHAINAWVEKQTKEKIKELLKTGTVSPDTRMVLANAIYFKGSWVDAFEKSLTKSAPFLSSDGTKNDTPMMSRKGAFALFQDERVHVLSMPYRGNELSMIVALPTQIDGLSEMESKLTVEQFDKWVKDMKVTNDVQVYFPKFQKGLEYSLGKTLQEMGMVNAFSRSADFGNMYRGDDQLSISLVVHKAFVDVSEEGTEAAAATGVVMKRLAAPITKPKIFRADHPFVFAIRHNATGAILFLGRIDRP